MAGRRGIVTLIGYKCFIIRKADNTCSESQIVGETANTVLVKTAEGVKKIPKKGYVFKIISDEGVWIADGEDLLGRPAQRLKRIRHAWQRRV